MTDNPATFAQKSHVGTIRPNACHIASGKSEASNTTAQALTISENDAGLAID
jgi:hypothetical protein